MSVADLRAKALAFTKTQKLIYSVYLDDAHRSRVNTALSELSRAHESLEDVRKNPPAETAEAPEALNARIGQAQTNPLAEALNVVKAAEDHLELVEAEAPDSTLLLTFRRFTSIEYKTLWDQYATKSRLYVDEDKADEYAKVFLAQAYVGASSILGEDVELTFDEALEHLLNAGDVEMIQIGLAQLNRSSVAVPFVQTSFGKPATS